MTSTTLPRSRLSNHLYGWRGGEGPNMMLIHGVGLNADCWTHIIPHLAQHFSITALDLPGHGASPSITATDLSDYSEKIAEILSAKCFIVGHSLGALLTIKLAESAQEKIAAIAPLNTIYQRSDDAKKAVKMRASMLSETDRSDPAPTLERWFGSTPKGQDKKMSDLCSGWLSDVNPKAYKQAYTLFAEAKDESGPSLAGIHCPALFITGADEPNSTPKMSQALAKSVADGRALIVPDAKHMMPMTHAEIVAEHLIQFYQTEVLHHA